MLIPSVCNPLRLILSMNSQDSEKMCLIFEKGVITPKKVSTLSENHPIRVSMSKNLTVEVSSSYPQNRLCPQFTLSF